MNEMTIDLALGLAAGLVLGGIHLRWLWQSTRRLARGARRPLALLWGAALRLGLVAAGLLLVVRWADQPAIALPAALAGFMLVRLLVFWRVRRTERRTDANHA
ncbi:ATP synthase subunit I [Parapusillimonas granuli]|uniref:ATP synthase subunit I n=1 Tax=Parapusillimonas granuli TaxID=380911 RepID=A0A853FYX7_9BURK|nr:ATP synthase subunit I [Parapusillimonas granuli]MBB5214957.1 F1F0 ATPase subunit 2 [Parapusillimonas granuli]MEB2401184.1 hypothetical protein [Alcaligenaceae bacterium]NYT49279.1 hypothetical protein [Parapusillimonas granuli]